MKVASEKLSCVRANVMLFLLIILASFCFISCDDLYITNVSPEEVKAMIDSGDDLTLLDVREPDEYCDNDGEIPDGHIAGTINMPYESKVLSENYKDLDKDMPIVVICRSGNRSLLSSIFLWLRGFRNLYNMEGGMKAWPYTDELEFCTEE